MGFFKKHILPHVKAASTGGLSLASRKERKAYRHGSKSTRKKLGFTGERLKKMFGRSVGTSQVLSGAPTSATTFQGRSISQLMGGV